MARRILIIVTRMYATQGGPDDEFVVMWKQDSNSPHAIIGVHRDTYRIIVLVHGYQGRFRGPNDVPGAVQEAINSLAITDSDEIGILYHPPAGWTLGRNHFSSLGGNIQFVKKYGAQSRTGYVAIGSLAQQVVERRNFTGAFDRVWSFFMNSKEKLIDTDAGRLHPVSYRVYEFLLRFLPLHLELQLKNRSQPLAIDEGPCRRDLAGILESLRVSRRDQRRAERELEKIINSIRNEKFEDFDNAYRALRDHLFSLLEKVEAPFP